MAQPSIHKIPTSAPSFLQRIGLALSPILITVLMRSLRIRTHGVPAGINERGVIAFWHGEMLVPWYMFRNRDAAALTSASADGEILARILKKWGFIVVRGSSSSGGGDALAQIVSLAQESRPVLLTPDGPRGPVHKMKIGALIAAQRSATPLYVCSVQYHRKISLRSWDAFQIPIPFSLVEVRYSEPIIISPDCLGEPLLIKLEEIEHFMTQLHDNS